MSGDGSVRVVIVGTGRRSVRDSGNLLELSELRGWQILEKWRARCP